MPNLKRTILPTTVFITGACVLIVEVVATRILAPYFGNTIYSVSSVLSVVLAALSLGYYIGGRLADKRPSMRLFFALVAGSGISVLAMQFVQVNALPMVGYSLPLRTGPLVMGMLLFFVPSFILGMLSPFAIALQQKRVGKQGIGTTTGEMFFFSTVGSIVGSLLAGFVLVPHFGIQNIVIGTGLVLLALGLLPLAAAGLPRSIIVGSVLVAAMLSLMSSARSAANVVYTHDGVYERILIGDGSYRGWPVRYLQQDTNNSAAVYADSNELVYDYTKYYAIYELFGLQPKRAMVLGGGAYSIPKALLESLPHAQVDVAEIEPSLYDLSRSYFRLPNNPRLSNYAEDGRRLLHDTPNRYDMIFGDVYQGMVSIPAHVTTREFMQLVHDRLTPNGIFVANVIANLDQSAPSLLWSEVKTIKQAFPQVYVFSVHTQKTTELQNIIVVASKQKQAITKDQLSSWPSPTDPTKTLADHYVPIKSLKPYAILTDDYAPVDSMTARILSR